MLPIYDYNGSLAGDLLEDTDVINELTSSDTTKALSAAQGKALNDKIIKFIGNITKMVYVTKVFQIQQPSGFQNLYSEAELMEILGVSGTIAKFNEKIFAYCLDGDWSSNNAYFTATMYDPSKKVLMTRVDNATVGACRMNFLIVYCEEGETA